MQQTLATSDGAPGDELGSSVALDGDTAVVGASSRASGRGAAYVFVRAGNAWTQQQTLTASDGAPGDGLGTSVALSGETILVGAASQASKQGAAYAFVRAGSTWTEQQKLTASDGAAGDELGASTALVANTAALGAPSRASKQGAAYVFVRSGATWTEQQALVAKGGVAGDAFGASVALSGETALIGAPERTAGQGAVHVFGRVGASWTEQQTLTGKSEPQFGPVDLFGHSVAVTGGMAVVGAPGKLTDLGQIFQFSLKSSDGDSCSAASDCASGFCADGVCCDTACDTGACDACSKSAGAASNGTCALLDGVSCGSSGACENPSTCQAGICTASPPSACAALDECHGIGTCSPATGACSNPVKGDGAPCSIGVCAGGACVAEASSSSGDDRGGGCGCAMGGSPSGGVVGLLLGFALAIRRLRRRHERTC